MHKHGHWNYSDQEAWKHLECSHCNGKRQSPVAIVDAQAVQSPALSPLKFEQWGTFAHGTAKNNGHGVNFAPESGEAKFTNHKGTYILKQFHMHWGRKSGEGSEHTLNGKQYEAEIHFVHLKEGADNHALTGDSLAVLGVFCEEDTNAEATGVWKQLQIPADCGNHVSISDVNYQDLLPTDARSYYHYEGSLTTPPCSEVVMWYVLKDPIKIPSAVLNQFRQIKNAEGQLLEANFRHVQPLNGREIQKFIP